MAAEKALTAIGLMSGTSLDGVDAAIVRTDGIHIEALGPTLHVPYAGDFRERLRARLGCESGNGQEALALTRDLTLKNAEAACALAAQCPENLAPVSVVGFHGHTILHRPEKGVTVQIGDGDFLAGETGLSVVSDFRSRDMAGGGEGAPLASLYHAALASHLVKPLCILNIGGVANVTWIGRDGAVRAFDTGPGNALIDDWTLQTIIRPMDEDGRLARGGEVNGNILEQLLDHEYFRRPGPKSLDRNDFSLDAVTGLSAADGAATLTAFTAASVAKARSFLPAPPRRWLVCGGGRHNSKLMEELRQHLDAPVEPVEAVGWQGDALEAQAFGFLAVRSVHGLPLSLPTTTGVAQPMTGGILHRPPGGTGLV